jgi:hypothetical protein
MTDLTLLIKALNNGQIRQIDDLLKAQFAELDVEVQVRSNSSNRWIKVSLSGEDEAIASAFIKKEIGTCPTNLEDAKSKAILKGYVHKLDLGKKELIVDVGIFEPKIILASVPLAILQTQLFGGKAVDLKAVVEVYGLAERMPVSIKLDSRGGDMLQAELAPEQVEKLHSWQMSLLDRLIILGASKETIQVVLERTRLTRDVIDVETLGLFEFALTCKLGTNAAGIVSIVGKYLRNAVFVVFNAQRSLNFLGEHGLTS